MLAGFLQSSPMIKKKKRIVIERLACLCNGDAHSFRKRWLGFTSRRDKFKWSLRGKFCRSFESLPCAPVLFLMKELTKHCNYYN